MPKLEKNKDKKQLTQSIGVLCLYSCVCVHACFILIYLCQDL